MIITIVCVGRTKKDFVRTGIQEYEKRIAKYAKIKWVYIEPSKAKNKEERIEQETRSLVNQIEDTASVFVFDKEGKMYSSETLASRIIKSQAVGKLYCIIGGSDGLDTTYFSQDSLVSLGPVTYEHDLVRLCILEQLYRGLSINAGAPYHK